ncbi:MAG: anti-sigma factor family protein [Actinomycetales bacterium]
MTAHPFVPAGPAGPVGPVGPHLGDRITALVDEALPADARDRALVHIAGCDLCRGQVETERLLKVRLSVLPAPQVPARLTAQLLAMAEPGGPIPPRPGQLPTQPRAINVPSRPAAGRPQGSRPAGRADRNAVRAVTGSGRDPRRTVRLAALAGAALSTMVVAVVGLSAGVGSDSRTPPLTQLTSNVGSPGSVVDPMVDVSRVIRKVGDQGALVPTP